MNIGLNNKSWYHDSLIKKHTINHKIQSLELAESGHHTLSNLSLNAILLAQWLFGENSWFAKWPCYQTKLKSDKDD